MRDALRYLRARYHCAVIGARFVLYMREPTEERGWALDRAIERAGRWLG